MKETVVIEYLDSIDTSKVAVLSYEDGEVGSVIEVCSRSEASENYDILGELRSGKVVEFDTDDYEEDDFYNDDEDEEI